MSLLIVRNLHRISSPTPEILQNNIEQKVKQTKLITNQIIYIKTYNLGQRFFPAVFDN